MKIATHNGTFHADDVFGIAILKLIYPDCEIIRSRDPDVLASADIRVDVGKENNPDTGDYDHHQQEGGGARRNRIPYASAGLVWKQFGKQLISENLVDHIDLKLIQPLDAGDNGIKTYEKLTIEPYTMNEVISSFNPDWTEDNPDFDKAFLEAIDVATQILLKEIKIAESFAEADRMLHEAVDKSEDDDIIVLDKYCPWKNVLPKITKAFFLVFPSSNGQWNVQGIPAKLHSFEIRMNLPEAWGGLDNEELAEVTGVKDSVFCHRALFIAGAKTKEGALALAKLALQN